MNGSKVCLLIKRLYFKNDNITLTPRSIHGETIVIDIETTVDYWLNATQSFREKLRRAEFSRILKKAIRSIYGGRVLDDKFASGQLNVRGLTDYVDGFYKKKLYETLKGMDHSSNKSVEGYIKNLDPDKNMVGIIKNRLNFVVGIFGMSEYISTIEGGLSRTDISEIRNLLRSAQEKLDTEILNLPPDITNNNSIEGGF